MGISLKRKTVLITGASAGIGAATARAFAGEGARLLLCARRDETLQEMVLSLQEAGAPEVFTFGLDVQNRREVQSALSGLPSPWKDVDILVNNAGLSRGLSKLWEDDIQNWEEMIDTNVKGLLYVTRAIVPGMVERNSGHIINLGSLAGHGAYPAGHVYCGTKAAERSITDGLRLDLNGTAVRVTSIDPGLVETDFSRVRFRGDEERAAKVYAGLDPLTPDDIAETIVWAATRPAHVDIQTILLTCVAQANSFIVSRHQ